MEAKVNNYIIFKPGETVLYQNGSKFELGVVKRLGPQPNTYFVWYHTGDTTACTHARNLHKIVNSYAFDIKRKTLRDDEIEKFDEALFKLNLVIEDSKREEWDPYESLSLDTFLEFTKIIKERLIKAKELLEKGDSNEV